MAALAADTVVDPAALRRFRLHAGLRQQDVARELGVAQQAISQYESGIVGFPLDQLGALARLFGATEADFTMAAPAPAARRLVAVPTPDSDAPTAGDALTALELTFRQGVVDHMFDMSEDERCFARDVGRTFFGLDL